MNHPRFYKTENGDIINLSMITQMYKHSDDVCIIELASGNASEVSKEDMERIYKLFRAH